MNKTPKRSDIRTYSGWKGPRRGPNVRKHSRPHPPAGQSANLPLLNPYNSSKNNSSNNSIQLLPSIGSSPSSHNRQGYRLRPPSTPLETSSHPPDLWRFPGRQHGWVRNGVDPPSQRARLKGRVASTTCTLFWTPWRRPSHHDARVNFKASRSSITSPTWSPRLQRYA